MEKIMVCAPARDSNTKEVEECESLVIDIPPDLPHAEWREYCIYRVPKQLRKVNEEAYTPKLLSIGPFHHIHPEDDLKDEMEKYKLHLKDKEKYKLKYLDDFFKRKCTKKISQVDLLKIIQNKEEEIRRCYSEDCRLARGDFVQMILLDAVFIIELFLKDKEEKEKEEEAKKRGENYCKKESDYILSQQWLEDGTLHDLILLENQLPFFVLEELYDLFAFDDFSSCNNRKEGQQIKEDPDDLKKKDSSFVNLSRNYFRCYDKDKDKKLKSIIDEEVTGEPSDEKVTGKPIDKEVKHFTDLLRYLFCPQNMKCKMEQWTNQEKGPDSSKKQEENSRGSSRKQEEESSGTRFWKRIMDYWRRKESSVTIRYCATKLVDAGLNFKGKDDRCLLDIQPPRLGVLGRIPCFGRLMEVPKLKIDDYTETLLRNLMALEQRLYPSQTHICNYVFLLDHLIDEDKDVDLLVQKEVIENLLGSNKIVAELINKLCDHILVSRSTYFDYISQKLNEHYEYPLNRTMATLKGEYFPNVFRGTATVVGLIVLGFTFWNFLTPFVV